MKHLSREIARNASVVALATLASRLMGFARDAALAFALGAGISADAFFVAYRIPNTLRRLSAEGAMTMSFIPVFSRVRAEQGDPAAFAMGRSALQWLLASLLGLTLLAEIFTEPMVRVIAPGFADSPGQFQEAVRLTRICFPYIILVSGVSLCMGILNGLGHFRAPAFSPVLLNATLAAAALAAAFLGLPVADSLAWAVLAGGILQWLSQQSALKSHGFSWKGPRSWRDPGVARMGRLMLPTAFGAAVYQVNTLLVTMLASFLPTGSISYLYYADRLVEFPLGVFGLAVSTAALPSMSSLSALGKRQEFAATLRSTLCLTLFICLPAMAGLLALSEPLVRLLFGRGQFDAQAAVATTEALRAFLVGLPFTALARPMASAFYARENTRIPVIIAAVCMAVSIALGALLMQYWAHVGLALAVSISSALNFTCLAALLRREAAGSLPPLRSLTRMGLLSALVGGAAYATASTSYLWLALIPVWAVLYVALGRLLRMEEAELFLDMFLGRIRRASTPSE